MQTERYYDEWLQGNADYADVRVSPNQAPLNALKVRLFRQSFWGLAWRLCAEDCVRENCGLAGCSLSSL